MMKGLMDHCLSYEMALDCVKAKAQATEVELGELKAWKTVQEKKLALSKQVQGKLEKQTKVLKQVLKDKEKEIKTIKDQLCQAKEDVIREYRDSDALLVKLGGSFTNGFDDDFLQVKVYFPDLDLSHVSIDAQAQTSAQPIHSESTDELFTDDALVDDPHGDGETAPFEGQVEAEGEEVCPLDGDRTVEERHEETPIIQQQFLLLLLYFVYYHFLFMWENSFYSFRHLCFWVFVNNLPFTGYLLIAPCFFHLYIYQFRHLNAFVSFMGWSPQSDLSVLLINSSIFPWGAFAYLVTILVTIEMSLSTYGSSMNSSMFGLSMNSFT